MKTRERRKKNIKKRKEKGNKKKVFTVFLFVLIREIFLLIF